MTGKIKADITRRNSGLAASTSSTTATTPPGAAPSKPGPTVKKYIPRSSTINANNGEAGGTPNNNAGGSGGAPRVYRPRSETMNQQAGGSGRPQHFDRKSQHSGGGGGGGNGGDSGSMTLTTIVLSSPQLLVRYKIPRQKSEIKIQLEAQQKSLREDAESRVGGYGGSSSGYGGGGGGWNKDSSGGGRDVFFDNFLPSNDFKKGGKGGKSKDGERKGSEGQRPGSRADDDHPGGGRKLSSSNDYADDDDYTSLDSDIDVEDELEEEDYYGDEAGASLSSVPIHALRNMELEGYSLEEMQMTLYGEYGVKATMSAIRKRLIDSASEKRKKVRTGKTKRDRNKARNIRIAKKNDKGIVFPDAKSIQVMELASLIEIGGGEVVKYLMMNKGMMTSMTASIDMGIAKEIAVAFGKKVAGSDDQDDSDDDDDDEDDEEDEGDFIGEDGSIIPRLTRPPIVTIMGHVDHGKTTLLDTIRKTRVAQGEAGGITQAISAFKVKTGNDQEVTFIDTPGHAAFSEMRKRGANVTDIVVLVVAADDGVMEQTKECIAAARSAGCPIVLAINKIDKEGADIQGLITSLMSYDILVEEFGGDVQCAKVSAKKGIGIDELLDKVMLQAEVMALKAPYETKAEGTVLEARVDKGLGVVVSAIVQKGTLKVGDLILAGPSWGRVRRLLSDSGKSIKEAGPSTPVSIVGMQSVPNAGDFFTVTDSESAAREVAESRQRLARQAVGTASSAAIKAQAQGLAQGSLEMKEVIKVPIVIKGDVAGSVEALASSILALELSDDEAVCRPDIVYQGVGPVTSSDVAVASVSKAKIFAFNVAAGVAAMEEARATNVDIGYYNVVYDMLDEVEQTIKTSLAPPPGTLVGRAEIKKVFKLGKVGKIAGCMVTEGMVKLESQVRVMRGKRNPVFTGKLSSLKVVKDEVSEVPNGSECGMAFEDFKDFEEGDVIECFITGDSSSTSKN